MRTVSVKTFRESIPNRIAVDVLQCFPANFFKMETEGEKRKPGRKPMGKAAYTVTLTARNVDRAERRGVDLSAILDLLLKDWLRPKPR